MTKNITHPSGLSNTLSPEAYPGLIPLEQAPNVRDMFCYIIKHYGNEGINVTITRSRLKNDITVGVVVSDWTGKRLDIGGNTEAEKDARRFLDNHLDKILGMMRHINMFIGQFYMAKNGNQHILVDVRKNKGVFAGPGMVKDLFGKCLLTQEVIKMDVINEEMIDLLMNGHGDFACDIILKPSRFRSIETPNGTKPFYVEVVHHKGK